MDHKIIEIIRRLKKAYPDAKIALNYSNPVETLVSTILSAQCTDKRVNTVTSKLFKKYRTVSDYAHANLKEFEQDIRSTGFYRNKAKNIIESAKIIQSKFNSHVPESMEEILTLPGVSRKTANVVLSNAYGKLEGIVVDTHVKRISQRLGLTKYSTPEKIEQDLMKTVPHKEWLKFSFLIQFLGRDVCKSQNPIHSKCVLKDICPSSNI